MPAVDLVVETPVSKSIRARQVCAMFDVPQPEVARLEWKGEMPLSARPWSVGLIVGPSGCGKSSIMRHLWGSMPELDWGGASMLDDFKAGSSIQQITEACGAVGFNTIPAWLRPFHVLSNGEQFRADLARRMLELPDPIVVDEFTSVVDRQVAKIGAHAVQKAIRRNGRKFVAVTCHYDVIDWLQPDWVLEPATMGFAWRSVQPRPAIEGVISRAPYSDWAMFAPYHYLTNNLHRSARCFTLSVDGRPVAFNGVLHRPHAQVDDIMGSSRTVVLPDWQGLGLGMILGDTLGAAYKAIGKRFHRYPAHPAFIRAHDRSPRWKMVKAPGKFSPKSEGGKQFATIGSRPCAVFQYIGPAMDVQQARSLIGGSSG